MIARTLLIGIVMTLLVIPANAQNLEAKTFDAGVMAGYWFSGTVSLDPGGDADKDGAFLLRVFGDAYLMPKLAFGGYFNFSPYSQSGFDVNTFEFGISIKPRFLLAPDLAIKPGVNLGYRFTSSDAAQGEIKAFGANLSIEVQKQMSGVLVFGEFGFLAQPSGGNEFADVTFAPIFYIGGGIGF